MRMRGKVLLALALCIALLTTQLQITQANTLIPDSLVQYTQADAQVIPDTYNTGCKGVLTPITTNEDGSLKLYDLTIVSGNNNTAFVLDFAYRNKDITGTVYIENYDFSARSLVVYNEELVDREIKLVFNNCKFSKVTVGRPESNMSYEFNNCSINNFSGSNTTFNRCRFGDSNSDGLVPFRNIQVNDCFFTNMGTTASTSGLHIDGTQIYGHEGIDVQNVHFNNCRFAIPPLVPAGSTSYINACIMLSLEYSNGSNLSFNNIRVNGGGYSIYAGVKYDSLTLENVAFNNIRFGCANKYGLFYSGISDSVQRNNILSTDSLYVGSVWKENGQTHFSVTNDTNQERTLLIYTDAGTYTYTIPACITGSEITGTTTYDDFPFDMDIVVPADCQYAVCFDNTVPGCAMQLRFTNWGNNDVRLSNDVMDMLYGGNDDSFVEGQCGSNISFSLKKNGVLILNGSGSTDNYHSGKAPEWESYKDYIKEVQVGSGITKLGAMLFRDCTSLRSIQLPATLSEISSRAFQGCSSLQVAYYNGTATDWELVSVGTYNEPLLNALSFQAEKPPTPAPTLPPLVSPPDAPVVAPTAVPTLAPTVEPTAVPTTAPTVEPTAVPTLAPTAEPTAVPTLAPTAEPTAVPTTAPTPEPTAVPTTAPTVEPTTVPTLAPTVEPTAVPTLAPTAEPTSTPTAVPTTAPTPEPTAVPTLAPTAEPTAAPTLAPTAEPTTTPTVAPTAEPTVAPTTEPTLAPTAEPTTEPTTTPTAEPTLVPTLAPTNVPAPAPTVAPVVPPTTAPTNAHNIDNFLAAETQKANSAILNAVTVEDALNSLNTYTSSLSALWKDTCEVDEKTLGSLSQVEAGIKAKFGTSVDIVSEKNSTITITGIDNALLTIPQGGQLNVGATSLSDAEYAAAKANGLIDAQLEKAVAFHMDITNVNGERIPLKAPVRIRFTIPDELLGKDICLLHYASSGLELLDVTINGNTGEAIVRSFSSFALLPVFTNTSAPKMGEDTTVLFLLYACIFCLILLAAVDTIVYQYKKRYK